MSDLAALNELEKADEVNSILEEFVQGIDAKAKGKMEVVTGDIVGTTKHGDERDLQEMIDSHER